MILTFETLNEKHEHAMRMFLHESGLGHVAAEWKRSLENARELSVSVPHAVYDAFLDELAAGKGISKFKRAGIRSLLLNEGETIYGAVETADPLPEKGVSKGSVQLEYGPFVGATHEALKHLETETAHAGETYRFRLLRIPGIYVMAAWLHGEKQNLFMPIGQAPKSLKPYTLYSEKDFLALLKTLAREKLDFEKKNPE
ncbi:MAG TPA: hypothetical protein VFU15_05025 [Bacteroidia bacterium]|nr:hypothetical protein [Bacteroidia bacterium]